MSEYFVAANTRTSFTDLASESSATLNANSTLCGPNATTNNNNSNLHHQQHNNNQHSNNSNSSLEQQFAISALASKNPLGAPLNANPTNQNQTHPLANSDHTHSHQLQYNQHNNFHHQQPPNQSSQTPMGTSQQLMHSTVPQHHNFHAHGSITNNNTMQSTPSTATSTTRIPQPIRTQIPIHCYIEQLDACAEIAGYSSPLSDAELFSTTTTKANNSTIQSSNSQAHLHQSKLALESVTNSTNNSNFSSLANTNNLFNETNDNIDDNDDNETDAIEESSSNLNHLSSNSPSSLHPNNAPTTSNNNINTSNNGFKLKQKLTGENNHNFQACRETYAIVTSNVLYIDLLRTVLLQLGYSAMDLINAKGK